MGHPTRNPGGRHNPGHSQHADSQQNGHPVDVLSVFPVRDIVRLHETSGDTRVSGSFGAAVREPTEPARNIAPALDQHPLVKRGGGEPGAKGDRK